MDVEQKQKEQILTISFLKPIMGREISCQWDGRAWNVDTDASRKLAMLYYELYQDVAAGA